MDKDIEESLLVELTKIRLGVLTLPQWQEDAIMEFSKRGGVAETPVAQAIVEKNRGG
jgi:hypothetical protein